MWCCEEGYDQASSILCLQVQPCCVQMVVTGSNELVQDFEAGREVLVGRYSLQNLAGGLQVQLDLEQGCAQVQAFIDQEVALVKHQLLAADHHTPSTAPAPGKPCHRSPQTSCSSSARSLSLMPKLHALCGVLSLITLAAATSSRLEYMCCLLYSVVLKRDMSVSHQFLVVGPILQLNCVSILLLEGSF